MHTLTCTPTLATAVPPTPTVVFPTDYKMLSGASYTVYARNFGDAASYTDYTATTVVCDPTPPVVSAQHRVLDLATADGEHPPLAPHRTVPHCTVLWPLLATGYSMVCCRGCTELLPPPSVSERSRTNLHILTVTH